MIRRLHVPLVRAEDVIPHLAKQELHWKAGYSAQELAMAWAGARNDFPEAVRAALKSAPEYARAELIEGFFEREVELGSPGRNSQTDLMVIAGLGDGLGIIAVEGKVEESFAEPVEQWNSTSAIYEAKRYRCRHAMMLVHSFSTTHRWFEDFAAFSSAMRIPLNRPGMCSADRELDGVSVRLAWAADIPQALPRSAQTTCSA